MNILLITLFMLPSNLGVYKPHMGYVEMNDIEMCRRIKMSFEEKPQPIDISVHCVDRKLIKERNENENN